MLEPCVTVTAVRAQGLVGVDRGGTSDPYVRVSWGKLSVRSRTVHKSTSPEWGCSLQLTGVGRRTIEEDQPLVRIDVWDWNLIRKDSPLGTLLLPLSFVLSHPTGPHYYEQWLDLLPHPDAKSPLPLPLGQVLVMVVLDDLELSPHDLATYQANVSLSASKIKSLWAEFQRDARSTQEVRNVQTLLAILQRTGVLDVCVQKWSGSNEAVHSKQFKILSTDAEVQELVFRHFFNAFDTDHSGAIDFEELLTGLSFLLEGSQTDVCRMQFRARDRNGDGVLSKEEARHMAYLTVALIKAAFMLGIRMQKDELVELGLQEEDFAPICEAITGTLEAHDVATLEVELMWKYADKDGDGVVSEEEYVAWATNVEEMAIRRAELTHMMEPCIRNLKIQVQVAMTQLLGRVMR